MPTNEEIKNRLRTQWDNTAQFWDQRYEELDRYSRPINDWLCQRLQPGMRVLDLACGSGQPALSAALKVGSEGSVVATDIAPNMVTITASKAAAARLSNVDAQVMDIEALDYPDESFDAVTCRWGYMFAPDPAKAMAETRRVLKPGGLVAAAVWDVPANNPWMSKIIGALNQVQPPPPSNPDTPGPFRLAQGRLEEFIREAGLSELNVETVPFTYVVESPLAWWDLTLDLAGAQRARLATMSKEEQERALALVVNEAEAFREGDEYHIGASCICAVATR